MATRDMTDRTNVESKGTHETTFYDIISIKDLLLRNQFELMVNVYIPFTMHRLYFLSKAI